MKQGLYGIYKGNEFRVIETRKKDIEIISDNGSGIDDDFKKDGDIYYKEIDLNELYLTKELQYGEKG